MSSKVLEIQEEIRKINEEIKKLETSKQKLVELLYLKVVTPEKTLDPHEEFIGSC